uniref:Uncharacterized protein n=1 Tax=Anguilla anguilla TaxID=7936 RepID=A0A0E9WT41_ANGAN
MTGWWSPVWWSMLTVMKKRRRASSLAQSGLGTVCVFRLRGCGHVRTGEFGTGCGVDRLYMPSPTLHCESSIFPVESL